MDVYLIKILYIDIYVFFILAIYAYYTSTSISILSILSLICLMSLFTICSFLYQMAFIFFTVPVYFLFYFTILC